MLVSCTPEMAAGETLGPSKRTVPYYFIAIHFISCCYYQLTLQASCHLRIQAFTPDSPRNLREGKVQYHVKSLHKLVKIILSQHNEL